MVSIEVRRCYCFTVMPHLRLLWATTQYKNPNKYIYKALTQACEYAREEGIKHVRMTFPRIYFDKTKTARLVECIKRYRRSINSQTQEPGGPVHDEFSHGNDALRYLAMCADQLGLHEQKTSHPIFQQQAAGLNLARFGAGGASRAGY